MFNFALASLLLAATVSAHFLLVSPTSSGFDDDIEGTTPCGGFIPNFANATITSWHVGGDVISTTLAHPTANFLYRATLDTTAVTNWTQIYPIFTQTGIGGLCEPMVPAPAAWVGQKGILGVVANGPDGILYQCAAVVFVSGMGMMAPTSCTNGTGVTAAFAADASLSALVGSNSSTPKNAAAGLLIPAGMSLGGLLFISAVAMMVVG